MSEPGPSKVAGERRVDLLLALSYIKKTLPEVDGTVRFEFDMPGDVGVPLMRAIMRIEAELLLDEAERVSVGVEPRTQEERQADAFVELVRRLEGTDS